MEESKLLELQKKNLIEKLGASMEKTFKSLL